MAKREGCGFPFFVAKQAWGSPSDISPERFTFIKYANGCLPFKQSFSKRAWRRNVIDNRLYKQGLGQSVRLRGRALAEKRVFVRQLCRQSFPLRANGFSRSVRRQYALTFFPLFAPVRLLLLQYLFFVLSAPFVCFRQLRQRLFPFGRTFFCVRMPSVLTFFRPSAFRQTVAFAHVRFSFCYFAVVLRASRCR